MGGKNKQRTKNNVRPSSSGRSADQLTAVSLGGASLPGLFPTLVAPTIDTHLTTELQLCFKKFNKKDPITKAKALQELIELIPQSKVDDIVAALPTWTHFYKVLTADPDRKVRELTQCCHGAVVSACGRRVAPHLKQLMPVWLQAQYDEHAPAMSHAAASLQNTFPDSKLPEVLAFCKEEVMSHILDILIKNGDNAYIRKCETPEEAEECRARVCSGALAALRFVCRRGDAGGAAPLLATLLAHNAFWKYAASPDANLRASWYACMGSILERAGASGVVSSGVVSSGVVSSGVVSRLLRVATGARETSPRVAAHLWDALLALMNHVPNWHEHLEKKELFCKRVLEVLESGGWGDARQLSSLLLPLLASLPPDLLTPDFYNAFFDALLAGLEKKGGSNSRSEVWAWSRSVEECVRYVAARPDTEPLAGRVLRRWLGAALAHPRALLDPTATAASALLRHWRRTPLLARAGWQAIGSALAADLPPAAGLTSPAAAADLSRAIQNHAALLRALKTPQTLQTKSVRFDEPGSEAASTRTVSKEPSEPSDSGESSTPNSSEWESPGEREEYLHRLREIVVAMSVRYLEVCRGAGLTGAVVGPLTALLREFACAELWAGVAAGLGAASPLHVYVAEVRGWLASDATRCKSLVDFTFLMMKYLREDEREVVLKSFDSMSPLVVEWALSVCVCEDDGCSCPSVRAWLAGGGVSDALRHLARKAVEGSDTALHLLLQCFEADSRHGGVLSPSAVTKVIKLIVKAIEDASNFDEKDDNDNRKKLERVLMLSARLADVTPPPDHLLLALVTLSVRFTGDEEDTILSNRCLSAVRDAWSNAIRKVEGERKLTLYSQAASYIHRKLGFLSETEKGDPGTSDTIELNITEIEHIVSLCPSFLDSPPNIQNLLQFTKLLLNLSVHPTSVESLALTYDIVEGNLTCPFPDNDVSRAVIENTAKDISKPDVTLYMCKVICEALYMEMVLKYVDKEDYNDVLKEEYFENEFCNILYEYMVVCSLHKGYDYWSHYDIIDRSKSQLDSSLEKLISEISLDVRKLILNKLTEEAVSKGYYWCYARKYFSDKITSMKNESEATEVKEAGEVTEENLDFNKELERLSDNITGSGYFHSLQAWGGGRGPQAALAVCGRALLAAHAQLPAPDTLASLVDLLYMSPHVMLYHTNLSSCPWSQVICVSSIVECLRHAVTFEGWTIPAHVWDATTLATASLLQTLNKNATHLADTKVATVCVATLRLVRAVQGFVRGVGAGRGPAGGCAPHVARLPREWADVFTPDLAHNLYSIVLQVLETDSGKSVRSTHISVVKALEETIGVIEYPYPESPRGVALADAAAAACRALGVPTPLPYKYLAHSLLEGLLEPTVLSDAAALAAWSSACGEEGAGGAAGAGGAGGERPALSLRPRLRALADMLLVLDDATQHIRAGEETCSLETGSDVESVGAGLLLLADLLHRQAGLARGDLPHHYLQLYREGEYGEKLLTISLRLLPSEVLSGSGGAAAAAAWFERVRRTRCVGQLACRALYACVAGAGGAAARAWRAAAPPRAAAALDRLVENYITPHVVRHEFDALRKKAADMEDAEIRVNTSTYEVWVRLTLDEREMELQARLARTHPLAPPALSAPRPPAAAADTHWLMLYLTYQNGSVANAIKMWISSVTARVERATQCYICYCRLHPATARLPSVSCHTCRNKFHNVCLRKWFSSSGKSHCPLCRTKF